MHIFIHACQENVSYFYNNWHLYKLLPVPNFFKQKEFKEKQKFSCKIIFFSKKFFAPNKNPWEKKKFHFEIFSQ